MKKVYLIGAALISSISLAQQNGFLPAAKSTSTVMRSDLNLNQDRAPGDVIGSVMNFSTPGDWTINNSGVSGGGGWVIGTNGPDGFFSGGMGEIASTSGGNFALFDADGHTGEGIITMANPINLSTYSNVGFQFESYYRNFQGDAYFEISTNGTTWTTFQVHSTLPLNESTDNPELVSVNISAVAQNQATVWARFRYVSADDYAWMVDDVSFVEGYSDNLIIGQTFLSAGVEALDYYMIPTSQIADFTFGAYVDNNGTNDQTTSTLNVKVNNGTTDVYDQSSTAVTIPAFTSDSLELTAPAWTPVAGNYTITYEVASSATDEAPADNTAMSEEIMVGGIIYGRDNGVSTGTVGYLGSTPVPTVMGNYMEFFGSYSLGQVQIGVGSTSDEGALIYAEVKEWNGTDWVTITQSNDYTITSSDLGSIITLTLDDVIECEAGDIYFIGGGHYGENVRVATAQIGFGAIIFNDGAASQQNSLFIVRARETYVGIEENAQTSMNVSVYPNPASEFAALTFEIQKTANVSYTITDATGKVVYSEDMGTLNAGNYSEKIETINLKSGLYFCSLTVDGNVITERLVVNN